MFKKFGFFAAALAMALSTSAFAQDAASVDGGSTQGKFWVTSGFFSKHLSTEHAPRRGYNETNTGLGVEYVVNDNWRLAAGFYENSVYRTTRYAQGVWTPDLTTLKFAGGRLSAGMAVGVVDGYPTMNKGKFSPALLPVAMLEYKMVGVNLAYIPTVGGNVDGAVALQFKVKFF